MRTLLTAGTTGLFLVIGVATANSQMAPFRPAIDAIGNAEPPAAEGDAGIPDGVDFGYQGVPAGRGVDLGPWGPGVPAGRGKVTVDSAPVPVADSHAHRKMWLIDR